MAYINRKITKYLLKVIHQSPVTLLTGCRQSGKSTLLQEILPKYKYMTFDDLRLRTQAKNEPELFLRYNPPPIILDEIQHVPDLLSYIKINVDKKRVKGSYVLTGSQQFSLMSEVHESLAGRIGIVSLTPFSVEELYLEEKKTVPEWTELALHGLYPEPNVSKGLDFQIWYSRYIESLLNKDIKNNLKKDHLESYDQFIKLIATRASQEVNLSDLSKELGVSSLTVQSWIALLEKSQLVFKLQPYYKNLGKRIIKSPKLYFIDPGLVTFLTGHRTQEQIQDGPMTGAICETLVISEIVKYFYNRGEKPPIYYFRDNHGLETDLIIEFQNKILLAEIKSTANPGRNHISSMLKVQSLIPKATSILICNLKSNFNVDKSVESIYWPKISRYLDSFFR